MARDPSCEQGVCRGAHPRAEPGGRRRSFFDKPRLLAPAPVLLSINDLWFRHNAVLAGPTGRSVLLRQPQR